jgi:hypothetical protein
LGWARDAHHWPLFVSNHFPVIAAVVEVIL